VPEDGSATLNRTEDKDSSFSSSYNNNSSHSESNDGFIRSFLRMIGLLPKESTLKDAIQEVLEDHAEEISSMPQEERQLLNNVIDIGETDVEDIMIPQSDMVAVELTTQLGELRDIAVESGHTRLPVYEDSLDNIKGFIHVKDLLPLLGNGTHGFHISQIMRDVVFVPESMKASDLLLKMRVSAVHLAIVVDEYGGTTGLVTLEDLFEEIVGDIQDEHDEPEDHEILAWNSKATVIVDAKTRIDELEEALKISFHSEEDQDDYDTLGGLIFAKLGRVPTVGEQAEHENGVLMEVLDVDERRIHTVKLTRGNASQHEAA
jgi:CBS domain containing-hemolysin-like protein